MAASGTRAPLGMAMDVYRGEDGSYHVEADLPGADPDSIEVTVEHGVLTIRAKRTVLGATLSSCPTESITARQDPFYFRAGDLRPLLRLSSHP
jgi:hypothetical protein